MRGRWVCFCFSVCRFLRFSWLVIIANAGTQEPSTCTVIRVMGHAERKWGASCLDPRVHGDDDLKTRQEKLVIYNDEVFAERMAGRNDCTSIIQRF